VRTGQGMHQIEFCFVGKEWLLIEYYPSNIKNKLNNNAPKNIEIQSTHLSLNLKSFGNDDKKLRVPNM
jgi:hypothetical protein